MSPKSPDDELSKFLVDMYDSHGADGVTVRKHVEELWSKFKHLADPEFVEQFTSGTNPTFIQRYWEILFANILMERKLTLSSDDIGPDFSTQINGQRVWFELIAPTPGQGPDKIPESCLYPDLSEPSAHYVPVENILLRWRSAVEDKTRKFRQYTKDGVVEESDACVIVLNSVLLGPDAFTGISGYPAALEAVFPFGPRTLTLDRSSGDVVSYGYQFRPTVKKVSGSEIPTGIFLDSEYAIVSALVSGHADPVNVALKDRVPLATVHNPLAKHPLAKNILSGHPEYCALESAYSYEINDINVRKI
jgi:type I restriction enzyme S subunit